MGGRVMEGQFDGGREGAALCYGLWVYKLGSCGVYQRDLALTWCKQDVGMVLGVR